MQVNLESKQKLTKETFMFFMILFYPAVSNYIWRVVITFAMPFGLYFTNATFDLVVWVVFLVYVVLSAKKQTMALKTVVIWLLFVIITLLSFALTDYECCTTQVLLTLIFETSLFFVYGAQINIKNVSKRHMYRAAVVVLLVSFAYSLYYVGSKDVDLEDNMDFAYKVLPAVLVIISRLFTGEKKKLAAVFSVLGIVLLLIQGTRGPLFCVAVFIGLMIYKKYGFGRTFIRLGLITLVTVFLISSPFVRLQLAGLAERLDASGYSSRFITMMLEGELSDANGRDAVKELLLAEIEEDPFEIRGMFADRQATIGLIDIEYGVVHVNGTYAHSLWIEILFQWGVFLGGIILLLIGWQVIKLVVKCDKEDACIVMLFVCMGVIHLFLSGSYLTNNNFFFLMGLAMSHSFRKLRIGQGGQAYENC